MSERRWKSFSISDRNFLDVLRGKLCCTNLPDGAVFERGYYDYASQSVRAIVSHLSFDVVPDGAEIPYGEPLEWKIGEFIDWDAPVTSCSIDSLEYGESLLAGIYRSLAVPSQLLTAGGDIKAGDMVYREGDKVLPCPDCPDCHGSGQYEGFNTIESCAKCGGSGKA